MRQGSIGSSTTHAVINTSVPAPGSTNPWVTLCQWEAAALTEGRFDPQQPEACPECRTFVLHGIAA